MLLVSPTVKVPVQLNSLHKGDGFESTGKFLK